MAGFDPPLATHAPNRAFPAVSARRQRLAGQRLIQALDSGQIQLIRASRLRLPDLQPVAAEFSLRWPESGQPIAMALDDAGDGAAVRLLGQWLLRTGLAERSSLAERSGQATLSLPIPPALLSPGLAALVLTALEAARCDPSHLELRLSETALVDLPSAMLVELCELRDGGVQIAIGDFGVRLGAITLLRSLPLTRLHLDPALTYDLRQSGEDRELVAGLTGMAHALHLAVSARAGIAPDEPGRLAALGVDQVLVADPESARQASSEGP